MFETDPESGWKFDSGPRMFQPGDSAFAVLSDEVPMTFYGELFRSVSQHNVVPLIYKGLTLPPKGMTSTILPEAVRDFYRSKLLIVMLRSPAAAEQASGPFVPCMISAQRRNIPIWVVLIGSQPPEDFLHLIPRRVQEDVELAICSEPAELYEFIAQQFRSAERE